MRFIAPASKSSSHSAGRRYARPAPRLWRSVVVGTLAAASLTAATPAQARDLHGGVFVIGDSISAGQGTGFPFAQPRPIPDTPVPYQTAANNLLRNSEVDTGSVFGGNSAATSYQGPLSAMPAVVTANADTYIVQLGSNDASCLHYTANPNDPLFANYACSATDTRTPSEKIGTAIKNMTTLASTLLQDTGSCVIWAGPREVTVYGTTKDEWAFYNAAVRAFASNQNGRMVYADFSTFANNAATGPDPDFTVPGTNKPEVHMHKTTTGTVMAYWLMDKVITGCGRARK